MDSDGILRVDPAAMAGCAQALGGAAEALRSRLAELDGQVGEMLGGWQGTSGRAYSSAWDLWHRGAGEVMLGLSILAEAVGKAGTAYQHNESASAHALRGVKGG
ncbi:WXG100 family type VII secretion target [Mycobacterium noviomagense]|uniref:ESAT-6-like protein n=1 Tax=Mycobacterium noviomagense TaxID=459858 RepID=A0A7I7PG63_9MYCO|nr:WXG100 family type VII secretion target [Mycobacterium noviomagense]ORB17133.1 WXG100 family type VII secretion target [Mycobacterium noviomagense]BBY07519.1 ESAT-6-like protein EsxF [Mycobacterium noviomagense]